MSDDTSRPRISLAEMTECLIGAGIKDESMSSEEIRETYRAINVSKDFSFTESDAEESVKPAETITRILPIQWLSKAGKSEIKPKPFRYKIPKLSDNAAVSLEALEDPKVNQIVDKLTMKTSVDVFADILKVPLMKEPPCKIICHERKFAPPPYCDPELRKLSVEQRKICISNYLKEQLSNFNSYQKKSNQMAKWGAAIKTSNRCTNSLDKKPFQEEADSDEKEEIVNSPTTIEEDDFEPIKNNKIEPLLTVTIKGRQVKRKIYMEDDSSDDQQKKRKTKAQPVVSKSRKMSNEEVISRSKLFADLPQSSPKVSSRVKQLMTLTPAANERKAVEEKQISDCLASLNNEFELNENTKWTRQPVNAAAASSDDSDNSVVITEGPTIRKRVSPPFPAGRKSVRRRQKLSVDNRLSPLTTRVVKMVKKPAVESIITEFAPLRAAPSNSEESTECPICSISFKISEIQAHAGTCGEDPLPQNRIVCEICDKVFLLSTEFEVHSSECIKDAKNK